MPRLNGQWIVGTGINPPEFHEGFLLQIPEPSTILLLSAGGLALLFLRRRQHR